MNAAAVGSIGFRGVVFSEFLFWLHAAIILAGILMGLVLPWQIAVTLVVLHRIHLRIFDGCIVSRWQKKSADLSEEENYLQQMSLRLFNIEISQQTAKRFDHFLVFASLAVTTIANFIPGFVWSLSLVFLCVFAIFTVFRITPSKNKPTCNIDSCQIVTSSQFNSVGGVRLETLGFLFFVSMLVIELFANLPALEFLKQLKITVLIIGLSFSLGLIWLQIGYLKSICKLCMNIHAATIAIFVITVMSTLSL